MDTSGIEATQALPIDDYEDEFDQLETGPVAFLNVPLQKGFAGKEYPLFEGDNVVGRSEECKVCIPLKGLSREHACIEIHGDSHLIYDKGSRNRTRRNTHFLAASVRYELKDKDQLIFGDVECQFLLKSQDPAADDSDETGSESMFQTAPSDEMLDETREEPVNAESRLLGDPDEGLESDASCDILEPTQQNGNTELGSRSTMGDKTLGQDITVKETPAPSRTKSRLIEDMVLPESGSDTEDEIDASKPPPTLHVPDSQDDEDDGDDRSRLLGAPTQAFVGDSDISTDEEDNLDAKKSLLMAPTQAFVGDSDVSTCSEASPVKKSILMAATQAFAPDSDTDQDQSSVKKHILAEPTQAYDMTVGIEPTQGYEMEVEDEKVEDQSNSGGLMFEPTQAFLGNSDKKKEEEDDDGKSDTSEEFVLEGDTDTEDNVNDQDLMAAPTLACETQAVDDTEENDATVAVGDAETQVIDKETDKQAKLDETVAVTDGETQVIGEHACEEAFGTAREKRTVNFDDATQVIDDVDNEVKKGVEAEAGELETQVIVEDATQVIDVQPNIKGRKNSGDAYCVETQVFENESTQVFDNKKDTEDEMDSTQVFDNISPQNKVIKTPNINRQSGDNQATQVFDGDEHNNVSVGQENSGNLANEEFDDSDIEMFDINAAATLAHSHDESHINESVKKDQHHETDATQVFEDATVAVDDDELSSKKCPQKVQEEECTQVLDDATVAVVDSGESPVRENKVSRKMNVSDDATQVFDDATVAVEDEDESPVKKNKASQKLNVSDDATQVFDDATVAVVDEDEIPVRKSMANKNKLNISDDATQVFDDNTDEEKNDEKCKELKNTPVDTDATQVIEDATVDVSRTDPNAATQVFDEAVAVEDNYGKKKGKGKRTTKGKKVPGAAVHVTEIETDATQVLDDVNTDKKEIDQDATTQVFDEIVGGHEVVQNKSKRKGRKLAAEGEATHIDTEAATHEIEPETVPVEDLESGENDATENTESKTQPSAKRGRRGKATVENITLENTEKTNYQPKINSRSRRGRTNAEVEEAADDEKKETEEETKDVEHDHSIGRQSRSRNKKDVPATAKTSNRSTRGMKGINDEKHENEDNEDEKAKTSTEEHESEDKELEKAKTSNESTRKKKGKPAEDQEGQNEADEKEKKTANEEAATQVYASDSESEATQKFGVVDDDATQDLDEVTDISQTPPVPEVIVSPSKTPLKSALASPEKRKGSPSPKNVAFVKRGSETSSESSQETRSSRRRSKVAVVAPGKSSAEPVSNSIKTKTLSKAPVSSTRRGRRSTAKLVEEEPMEMDCELKVETSEDAKVKEEVTSHEEKPTRRGGRSKQAKANVKVENGVGEVSAADESKTELETFDKVVARRGKRMVKVEKDTKDLVNADLEKVETSEVDKVGARRGKSNVKIEKDTEELESADLEKVGKRIMKIEKDTDELVDTNSEKGETSQVHTVGPRRGKRGINKKKNTELKSSDMEIAETSEVPVKKSRRGGKLDETKDEEPSVTNVEKSKSKIMMIEKIEDKCDEKEIDNEIKVDSNDKPGRGNKQTRGRLNKAESESETANKNKVEIINRRGTRKNVSENPDAADDGAIEEKAVITGSKRASRSKVRTDDVDKATHVDESVERKGKRATRNKTSEEDESSLSDGKQGSSGKANTSRDRATSSKGGEEKTEAEVEAHEDTEVVIEKVGRGKTNTRTKQKIVESQEDTKDNIKSQDDSEHKVTSGRKGRSVRSKQKPVENIEQSDNSENSSQDSIRGNRRTRQVKEESSDKNEVEKVEAVGKRNGGQKRKESDSDSQKSEEEKPDKRQKTEAAATPASKRRSRNLAETPKHLHKRVSAVYTPKSTGKSVVSEVTNSPTLRKTTTEGHRAKVMFTGVVDEQGEKIVKDLGGELVGDVTMVTHLVTDQVRRTMKFLCCVARGVPIVSPEWLKASKDSGMFLDPTPFLVKDDASEKKYKFILHLSLDRARDKPMLQGMSVHVTKSVKPPATVMKDILQCAGAKYLASMPKSASSETVVVSCDEDRGVCDHAVKNGVQVVSPEFVLSGILRQEVDITSYRLFHKSNGKRNGGAISTGPETANKKRKR